MDFVDDNSFPTKVFKGHALVRLLVSFRSELSYGGCVNMSVMSSLISSCRQSSSHVVGAGYSVSD